jgi:hypothetical protein
MRATRTTELFLLDLFNSVGGGYTSHTAPHYSLFSRFIPLPLSPRNSPSKGNKRQPEEFGINADLRRESFNVTSDFAVVLLESEVIPRLQNPSATKIPLLIP